MLYEAGDLEKHKEGYAYRYAVQEGIYGELELCKSL